MSLENIIAQMEKRTISLLGSLEVTEKDYLELLNITKSKVVNLKMDMIRVMPDLFLSITLVQIAIREYEHGNYWQYFLEELDINISASKRNSIGQIFMMTLKEYNLFLIDSDEKSNNQYVQNILVHAYVTNNYLDGYFDFVYSFYDRNLLRQIHNNIDEEINELKDYMHNTLLSKDDYIQLESTEKHSAKTYRLLRSTRNVFAQSETEEVYELIIDHLKMLDVFYYDDVLPTEKNRFAIAFIQWVETIRNEVSNKTQQRKRLISGAYSRSPYLKIDKRTEKAYLVLPEQKFRESEVIGGQVYVTITTPSFNKTYKLDLYRAYGIIKSEILQIEIEALFTTINIEFNTNNSKTYRIEGKNYRIINDEGIEIKQFKIGPCYLLTSKNSKVKALQEINYTNELLKNWNVYFIIVKEDTVVYVDHTPLSIVGEFSEYTIFESSNDYVLLDSYDKELQTAFKHPVVSFKVDKSLFERSFIWINDERYLIDKPGISSKIEFINDPENYGVSIPLELVAPQVDGEYTIYYDEPGKTKRLLSRYVLITQLVCHMKNRRITFDGKAQIILAGAYDTEPLNCVQVNDHLYEVDMTEGLTNGQFLLQLNYNTYKLQVPTNVFKYKFYEKWYYTRPDYFWYKGLTNDLTICIPGAIKVSVYLNNDMLHLVEGEEVAEHVFHFDISPLVQQINKSKNPWNHLNILYTDSSEKSLPFLRILNRLYINTFFLEKNDDQIYAHIDYIGDANLFIEVSNYYDPSEKVIKRRELISGKNLLTELNENGLYNIECIMSEPNGFFGAHETPLHFYKNLGIINYKDISNCKVFIQSIKFQDEYIVSNYRYMIRHLEKVNENDYIGIMYELVKNQKGKFRATMVFERVRLQFFDLLSTSPLIYLYVEDEGDWVIFYYDRKTRNLISSENEILYRYTTKNANDRFIELYEDDMTYEIVIRRDK